MWAAIIVEARQTGNSIPLPVKGLNRILKFQNLCSTYIQHILCIYLKGSCAIEPTLSKRKCLLKNFANNKFHNSIERKRVSVQRVT